MLVSVTCKTFMWLDNLWFSLFLALMACWGILQKTSFIFICLKIMIRVFQVVNSGFFDNLSQFITCFGRHRQALRVDISFISEYLSQNQLIVIFKTTIVCTFWLKYILPILDHRIFGVSIPIFLFIQQILLNYPINILILF